MKTLLLIRHAKSSWASLDLEDIDRTLNQRGLRDAPIMGLRLKNQSIQPDLIVSSPAVRARTTAMIFAEQLNYDKTKIQEISEIYDAAPATILQLIKTLPDTANTILMFGHNPAFTMVANHFSKNWIDNVPTCGIFAIEFNSTIWKNCTSENAQVLFFDYPKNKISNGE